MRLISAATVMLGLALCVPMFAQNSKPQTEIKPTRPCLAVSTNDPNGYTGAGPFRTWFYYVESSDLSVEDIQTHYNKKDLEKLEGRGVKIVVTTKEAVSVREHTKQTNTESGSEANSSSTTQSSAGCN
jgi:hypothetical protein